MNALKATISAAALLCAVLLAAATKPASQPTSTKPPVVGDIAPAMDL
jgi:hypothetical protein